MRRTSSWTNATPLIRSIVALYALGMMPKAIGYRLGCATNTVSGAVAWFKTEWSATTGREACQMEWEATTGEPFPRVAA